MNRSKPLTMNKGFVGQMLRTTCTAFTTGSTMCYQIRMLPAYDRIKVDTSSRQISVSQPHLPKPVNILTEEGFQIIDRWINKWTGIIRGIADSGVQVEEQLTGGFDSRISFSLVLASGVDYRQFSIKCNKSAAIPDDIKYAIEISKITDFDLNAIAIEKCVLNYDDDTEIYNYSQKFVHPYRMSARIASANNCFRITGYSGEVIRNYWHRPYEGMYKAFKIPVYGEELARETANFFLSEACAAPYMGIDREFNPGICPMYLLYRASRTRWHFGACSEALALRNITTIDPLSDPMLLRLDQADASDHDLFYAIIMRRIGHKIMDIPYQGGRSFSTKTRELAQELNAKYPLNIEPLNFDLSHINDNLSYFKYSSQNEDESEYLAKYRRDLNRAIMFFNNFFDIKVHNIKELLNPYIESNAFTLISIADILEYNMR